MVQPINLKHTSELVMDFRHQLLKRREHLYDLRDSVDDSETHLIDIVNDELDRIENIFKLIQKNKI
jgi:hypothetical protein